MRQPLSSHPTGFQQPRARPPQEPPPSAEVLLHDLLESALAVPEEWEKLPKETRAAVRQCTDVPGMLSLLVEHGLLTEYQARRIEAGTTHGLLLGNYRVLDRLGAGGMGVVFKAEHVVLRRPVAIKVLAESNTENPQVLLRFFAEMRAVAQLQHPNIVGALDAGKVVGPDPNRPTLHYLVMEYVPGQNLEDYVNAHGPLPLSKACDLAYQVACALGEAHKHQLVHRDLKPSNVMVTPEDQAKLLDFGLVHHFHNRLTAPSITLGTIDYMAPEQIQDAGGVDIRADVFGLGGILYWSLTGRTPYQLHGGVTQALTQRLTQPPPSVAQIRPDVPPELDAVVGRMMALNRDDRYRDPKEATRALLPFLEPELRDHVRVAPSPQPSGDPAGMGSPRVQSVLIVDDEASIRSICRFALQTEPGVRCDEAGDGLRALEAVRAKPYDLILLDVDMPQLGGTEVCRRLRESPPGPNLKIVMFSGRASADEMARMLLAGADDFLTKPFSLVQLQARVKAALRLKEAQDRTDLLNRHLLTVNRELEHNLTARDSDLTRARNALVLALARCVEYRDGETTRHLVRLQRYCRCLAEEAARLPVFAGQIDPTFIEMLECCAPLHDIGKIGLPDHILLKPGKLTPEERLLMQAHTIIGADTLKNAGEPNAFAVAFWQMAHDIARHHHERFDGKGYPDQLAGSDIPLAARIVAVCNVYDALRSRRVYKPALSHAAALQLMTDNSAGQFDPALLQAFRACAGQFEQIYRELGDEPQGRA